MDKGVAALGSCTAVVRFLEATPDDGLPSDSGPGWRGVLRRCAARLHSRLARGLLPTRHRSACSSSRTMAPCVLTLHVTQSCDHWPA